MEDVKVLILCGGKGTRAYPFTEHFPKVMMPVNGSPILMHLMRIYASQGFRNFVLAAGHRKEMLYDYFSHRALDWNIEIVDTGDDADTGDRVLHCAPYLGQTFFATYGDGLGNVDLTALLEFHRSQRGLATLTTVPLLSQYGLVRFAPDGRVIAFQEKPVIRDHWINAGFFTMEKAVFDNWNGHNLENDILPQIARQEKLFAYRHDGFWKSLDTSKDQQELEQLYNAGSAPWVQMKTVAAAAG